MLNPAHPYFYILAYVVILYIRPQEYVPSLIGTPIVPVLLVFATLFWLVAQKKNFDAPQLRLMPGLAVAIFISVAMTGWMSGAIAAIVDFVPTMIVFYLVATSVDSIKRFREMSLVLTAVCCVMAVHGIGQAASEEGIGWTGAQMIDGRITYLGFLQDPNDLSMAFLMTLPFTLYLAGTSRFFLVRLAHLGAAALILYGVYLCNSRGSFLAIGAMLLALSIRRFGWTRSLVVAPLLVLPLVFLAPSRLGEISADEESAAGRVDAWYQGFQMLIGRPLFGVGKGGFLEWHTLTAHNSFVLAMAELGVVGYFFWLAIVIFSGLMLYRLLVAERLPASPPGNLAADPIDDADASAWGDWQRVTRALTYSFVGTLVAIFFLSRSYIESLFLLFGLIIAAHQAMRARWPSVGALSISDHFKMLIAMEAGSIVALWLVTRVLLTIS